jgi:hypothetical protein
MAVIGQPQAQRTTGPGRLGRSEPEHLSESVGHPAPRYHDSVSTVCAGHARPATASTTGSSMPERRGRAFSVIPAEGGRPHWQPEAGHWHVQVACWAFQVDQLRPRRLPPQQCAPGAAAGDSESGPRRWASGSGWWPSERRPGAAGRRTVPVATGLPGLGLG